MLKSHLLFIHINYTERYSAKIIRFAYVNMQIDNDNLNFDWLDVQNRLANVSEKQYKECMKCIQINYIYVDVSANIVKLVTEKKELTLLGQINHNDNNVGSIISQEDTLKIIQTKKIMLKKEYNLLDILLYNVELEPHYIQNYSHNYFKDVPQKFLKSLSILKGINIPSTLFIFHQTNCIYFLFQEVVPNTTINTKTKKVFFKLQNDSTSKTQKHR